MAQSYARLFPEVVLIEQIEFKSLWQTYTTRHAPNRIKISTRPG